MNECAKKVAFHYASPKPAFALIRAILNIQGVQESATNYHRQHRSKYPNNILFFAVKESIVNNPSSFKMVELGPFRPSPEVAATHARQFYAWADSTTVFPSYNISSNKNLQAQFFWEIVESLVSCDLDVLVAEEQLATEGCFSYWTMKTWLCRADASTYIVLRPRCFRSVIRHIF